MLLLYMTAAVIPARLCFSPSSPMAEAPPPPPTLLTRKNTRYLNVLLSLLLWGPRIKKQLLTRPVYIMLSSSPIELCASVRDSAEKLNRVRTPSIFASAKRYLTPSTLNLPTIIPHSPLTRGNVLYGFSTTYTYLIDCAQIVK